MPDGSTAARGHGHGHGWQWRHVSVGVASYGKNVSPPRPLDPAAPRVTIATPGDRGRVIDTLIAAFSTEPIIRWLFPDDDSYPVCSAAYFGHLFDRQVRRGAVWIAEGGRSAALWEPPGDGGLPGSSLPAGLPAQLLTRFRALDGALRPLLPAQPYWYLGLLGTHPAHAGRPLGRATLAAGLRLAAETGAPAVLASGSEASTELYRRAGWQIVASVTDPLPLWVLRR